MWKLIEETPVRRSANLSSAGVFQEGFRKDYESKCGLKRKKSDEIMVYYRYF